jgi:hypothetical protein
MHTPRGLTPSASALAAMLVLTSTFRPSAPLAQHPSAPPSSGDSALAALEWERAALDSTERSAVRRLDSLQAALRALDSVRALRDSLRAINARARLATARALRPTAWYAGALGAAVGVNARFGLNVDRGGYRDTYLSEDKITHFGAGNVLASTAIATGVRPRWAVALTCAGAAAFEWSQARHGGYFSNRDVVVGCAGATLAGLLGRRSPGRNATGAPLQGARRGAGGN